MYRRVKCSTEHQADKETYNGVTGTQAGSQTDRQSTQANRTAIRAAHAERTVLCINFSVSLCVCPLPIPLETLVKVGQADSHFNQHQHTPSDRQTDRRAQRQKSVRSQSRWTEVSQTEVSQDGQLSTQRVTCAKHLATRLMCRLPSRGTIQERGR